MVNVVYFYTPDDSRTHLIEQLQVSIFSVLSNRNMTRDYAITVYCTDESEDLLNQKLNRFKRLDCNLTIVPIGRGSITERNARIPLKLFAMDKACSFERFVFLDLDTIVTCDIAEVYDYDLCGYPIGGVEDIVQTVVRKTRSPGYINSGVLVCDTKLLARVLPGGFSTLYDKSCSNRFHDQDAINAAIPHFGLPQKYNRIGWGNSDCEFLWDKEASIIHYASIRYEDLYQLKSNIARTAWITYSTCINPEPNSKKILLARKHRAFGDWIMFSDMVKTINLFYPDVEVCVEDNSNARTDILDACGCKYTLVKDPVISDYAGYDPHVLYNTSPVTPNKHILVSMMENLCHKIPTIDIHKIKYIDLVHAGDSPFKIPDGDYVIVPHYTRPLYGSIPKEYSRENYDRLVTLLTQEGYKVYELNCGDVELGTLDGGKSYKDSVGVITTFDLKATAKIMKNAKFCVLIENGMNHWACHNGARTYCLFKSKLHADPSSLFYATMIPIPCYTEESPEYVLSVIKENEKQ